MCRDLLRLDRPGSAVSCSPESNAGKPETTCKVSRGGRGTAHFRTPSILAVDTIPSHPIPRPGGPLTPATPANPVPFPRDSSAKRYSSAPHPLHSSHGHALQDAVGGPGSARPQMNTRHLLTSKAAEQGIPSFSCSNCTHPIAGTGTDLWTPVQNGGLQQRRGPYTELCQ